MLLDGIVDQSPGPDARYETREAFEYPGHEVITRFIHNRTERRGGVPLRLVPTRANGQPAFGCCLMVPPAAIARPSGSWC